MMVKDEEDFLEDALSSARDFCDEMLVVDTGSTDRTVQIAKDMGARVTHFPWVWLLCRQMRLSGRRVDSGLRFWMPMNVSAVTETVCDPNSSGPQYPFQAVMLNVTNTRLDGSPISSFFSVRVFPGIPTGVFRSSPPLWCSRRRCPKSRLHSVCGFKIIHLGYDPNSMLPVRRLPVHCH